MLPADEPREDRLSEPLLTAVLAGHATVTVDGTPHELAEGAGLWVPAGARMGVRPRPGALLLPVPASAGRSAAPLRVAVPTAAFPALLHAFTGALGHLDAPAAPVEIRIAGSSPGPLDPLPVPSTPELRDLAELLTVSPGAETAAAVSAAAPGWSLRTVQRRFHAETGVTLAAWARHARLRQAAELLAEGRELEWIAHRVGYLSVAGFIRAFADATGSTPGQWRAEGRGAGEPRAQLVIPAAATSEEHRTWPRANGAHVAVWAAIGQASLTIGNRSLTLAEGDAVVIPAGVRNALRIPAGSLLVPVGYRSGALGPVGKPIRPARLGGIDSLTTVASMLAAYTRHGAVGIDPERGFDAVLAGSERELATEQDALLSALASVCSREPELPLAAAAARIGSDERALHRAVQDRAGEPLAVWRRILRMTRARNRLGDGETPSEISRALGYAHLPAFSRAFREVHGAGPAAIRTPNLRPAHAAWARDPRPPASRP